MTASSDLFLRSETAADGLSLRLSGEWTIWRADEIGPVLDEVTAAGRDRVAIDLTDVRTMDSAGAWLIHSAVRRLQRVAEVDCEVGRPEYLALLRSVADHAVAPCPPPPTRIGTIALIEDIGSSTIKNISGLKGGVAILGATVQGLARCVAHPSRYRLTPTVHQMEQVGLRALPIVGLMSFLIGIVIAYQGAFQLRQFGADIFVVNLVAISVLRELGIILTAIMLAGRSGSAFAAEIGAMKLQEEIDAMKAMGLDPMEVLVLPRVIATIVMMPILTFFADLCGLAGGGLMAWINMDITPAVFIERLYESVTKWTFLVGIIKAPFFAVIVALCGCYQGLAASGDTASVGRRTTKAVVQGIFLVIVLDAVFSILFSQIGI